MSTPEIERVAELIYGTFPYDGEGIKPYWVQNGNSDMQVRARYLAEKILTTHDAELREKIDEVLDAEINQANIRDQFGGTGKETARIIKSHLQALLTPKK